MSRNYGTPSKKKKDTLIPRDKEGYLMYSEPLNYSAEGYVSPSEDGRFNHGRMNDIEIKKDVKFTVDEDGNLDWDDYYKKMGPQVDPEELEEIRKQNEGKVNPFSPEYQFEEKGEVPKELESWYQKQKKLGEIYRDNPGLDDDEVYNRLNENGDIEFLESGESMLPYEGDIDQDLVFDEEDSEEDEEQLLEEVLYNKSTPSDGDAFLIVIDEDGEVVDNIVFVHEIREKDIIFIDEDENEILFFLDEEKNIILQSEEYKYTVLEFDKIQEIEPKDLEDDKLFLTKNIYDDIELDVEELKEKIYSMVERKESLITELISLFKAQKSKQAILDICELSDIYIQMLHDNVGNKFDYTDKLPFLKNVKNNNFSFPKWIIPISNNVKKLYLTEEDVSGEFEDTSSVNFEQELKSKVELMETNKEYESLTSAVYKTKPFYNKESGVALKHDGHYVRDCNDKDPCHGIKGEYIFELNKTRKAFKIPLLNKGETYYKNIVDNELLSLSGLYLIPHNNFNLTFEHKEKLPLFYTTIFTNDKYSYLPMGKIFNYDSMAPHIIGPMTGKAGLYPKNINSYFFDEFSKKENIKRTLDNLPNISDILENIPEKVMSKLYNHEDLKVLLLPYTLDYGDLDNDNKTKINEKIKENIKQYIKDYNKKYKRKIIKKQQKTKKILSTDDKIDLSWVFIQSIMNIPVKSSYIKQFIDVFSREPMDGEDERYLYRKKSPSKLLCKHYHYSSRIDDDEDAHISLTRIFGGIPKDGVISCNVCGEYLCPEDFSLLEGFADAKPKNTKEVLKRDNDSVKELSEKQISILRKIKTISSLLSLELNEFDKNTIIDFFDTVNDEELIDLRYKNTNTMKKHPVFKEISKKYKLIKPKTEADKEQNKKNKYILEKEKESFKRYLLDVNEFLVITYLILFHLQVSSPPYDVKTKDIFNLWNKKEIYQAEWALINTDIHSKISMKTVNAMFSLIEKTCKRFTKDSFWKNVLMFINEGSKYKTLSKAKSQFITTGYYILKNSKLRMKLKEYYQNQNDIHSSVYLRETWPSFKPSPNNKIVLDINKILNEKFKNIDLALKERGEICYENISSIRPFNYAYDNPRRKDLNIPYSDIMKNEAYKRLLEFVIHLHGIESGKDNIDLTINNFIETIQFKDIIEEKFSQIGWDKKDKRLREINYGDLRRVLFEIQEIFIEKDPKEKNTIKLYNYIKINNWNGMLLNGHPKRFYSYKNPIVLPFKTFDELKEIYDNYRKDDKEENGLDVIGPLFRKYCFDSDGNINLKMSHDEFILNIVADPEFEREVLCSNDIPITKANFEKIMNYKVSSKMLPLQDITNLDVEYLFENRLFNFIEKNKFLDYPGEYSFSLMKDLYSLKDILGDDREIVKKKYREVFSMVETVKNKYLENIKTFIEKSIEDETLSREQIKYYKKNRGKIENLDIFINDFLLSNGESEKNVNNIFYIIGRLSNNRNKSYRGTTLSSDIPKHWKLSETNESNLAEFIDKKEFLLHNEVFVDSEKYSGFYKYLEDEKYSYCFKGLLDYMKETYDGGIFDIRGDDNSYYNTLYSTMFKRFMLLHTFDRMIQYIDSLYDEQSLPSRRANELFLVLEERDQLQIKDSIGQCSQLFFDILMDMLDENNDTNWIYNQDISDKLSKQKETEKQDLINDLEGQTSEKRTSTVEMQNAGIINWYKDFSLKNLERIKDERYQENVEEERKNRIKELLLTKQTELEVSEQFGVNVDGLLEGILEDEGDPIVDEGYDGVDMDREDEGDDDGDNDGDYREN